MLTNPQYILLIPALVTALVGAVVQFAYQSADQVSYSTTQRLISSFAGWLITCIGAGIALLKWEWYFLYVAGLAFFVGLIAERFVMLFLEYMRKARTLPEMVRRGRNVQNMLTSDTPPTPPDNPDMP